MRFSTPANKNNFLAAVWQMMQFCPVQVPTGLVKQQLRTEHRMLHYFVPDPVLVHRTWQRRQHTDIPYWSQVWPSALALSLHIDAHPELVQEKSVLELGAGIGLPSITAAAYAKNICCSDAIAEALPYMELNAAHNDCAHFQTRCIDWTNSTQLPVCDVLLLSDVAYDPQHFRALERMLRKYLLQKTTILLSIPQRRVSTGFLEVLPEQPAKTKPYDIVTNSGTVQVQVLQLQ